MPLLEATNLRKTYQLTRNNIVEALRGVDISIEAGEMVAIMGPSGSGKSTLMHILGLLHAPGPNHGPRAELSLRRPRHGRTLSDGERTRIRARQMGFVFQQFNLVPTLSALENVMLAGDIRRHEADRSARQGAPRCSAMSDWPIGPVTGQVELSGGEQQRVAIARAWSTSRP